MFVLINNVNLFGIINYIGLYKNARKVKSKGKDKGHPITDHKCPEGE
jgi:hypothetical protein